MRSENAEFSVEEHDIRHMALHHHRAARSVFPRGRVIRRDKFSSIFEEQVVLMPWWTVSLSECTPLKAALPAAIRRLFGLSRACSAVT